MTRQRRLKTGDATVGGVARLANQSLALQRHEGLGGGASGRGEPCGHSAGLAGERVGAGDEAQRLPLGGREGGGLAGACEPADPFDQRRNSNWRTIQASHSVKLTA